MAFEIAELSLPGGARLGIAGLPGRRGEGLADLARIARWGAGLVISATTAEEMARHDMADLGVMLDGFGIAWAHLPIDDFGTPGDAAAWAGLAPRAHGVLDAGGAVLVHCLCGRGRSGMLALRLLVERGEEARAALARLRAVRPGAVETPAQFAWAAAGAGQGGR